MGGEICPKMEFDPPPLKIRRGGIIDKRAHSAWY